jgi:putative solute:sodium symporter small subunit
MKDDPAIAYWRANQRLIFLLLSIWAVVSFGFAILLARPLYGLQVGRLPMSFWWAQQGAMIVFVILIFVYAWAMDRLDRKYGYDREDEAGDDA